MQTSNAKSKAKNGRNKNSLLRPRYSTSQAGYIAEMVAIVELKQSKLQVWICQKNAYCKLCPWRNSKRNSKVFPGLG